MADSTDSATMTAKLREIPNTAQDSNQHRRRWFNGAELDLFVWQDEDGVIVRLQLCYHLGAHAFALSWDATAGFRHDCIDDGETRPARHKMSPLLVADGDADIGALLRRFDAAATEMETALRQAVRARLSRYRPNRAGTAATD